MLNSDKPARIHYYSGSYRLLSPGDYVLCAVTGLRIPINELRYWSAERQEAYVSADVATRRHQLLLDAETARS